MLFAYDSEEYSICVCLLLTGLSICLSVYSPATVCHSQCLIYTLNGI